MPDSIHIHLPDGSTKEFPKGTTALDVAKSISPRLADAALAAKARPIAPSEGSPNGDLIDLTRPLEKDTDLRILTDPGEGRRVGVGRVRLAGAPLLPAEATTTTPRDAA